MLSSDMLNLPAAVFQAVSSEVVQQWLAKSMTCVSWQAVRTAAVGYFVWSAFPLLLHCCLCCIALAYRYKANLDTSVYYEGITCAAEHPVLPIWAEVWP